MDGSVLALDASGSVVWKVFLHYIEIFGFWYLEMVYAFFCTIIHCRFMIHIWRTDVAFNSLSLSYLVCRSSMSKFNVFSSFSSICKIPFLPLTIIIPLFDELGENWRSNICRTMYVTYTALPGDYISTERFTTVHAEFLNAALQFDMVFFFL